MTPESDSDFLHKEPCPACGSRDNLARYSDGHGFCFGCGHYEHADGTSTHKEHKRVAGLIDGTVKDLAKRKITEETCKKWDYRVGEMDGKTVQIANYKDDSGRTVAQKVRGADKKFSVLGDAKQMGLYGQHLWRDKGLRVVITEGEIDALTVSQVQSNKWPVVSLPHGCQSAKKHVAAAQQWLEGFDEIVLYFDDDEPGRKAVEEVAPLLTPGKVKVARIPGFKDANEALQAGQGKAIIDAIWGAKVYRPDGVVSARDIAVDAKKPIARGIDWMFTELTEVTYGRRPGELYGFGAGTGIGKTDLFTQQMTYDINVLGLTVGVVYLEQPPVESLRRIAGKHVGKLLHVPGEVPQEEIDAAIEALAATEKLFLFDHFAAIDWPTVRARIKYMVTALGCKSIYLDHLTALVARADDERKALDAIMADMAGDAHVHGHMMHFISHLARPEGSSKPHEEGGRVTLRQFRGSNAIGMWSHFLFGLERNQQAENEEERTTTTLRCLKDRNTGRGTGKTIALGYEQTKGLLYVRGSECPFPTEDTKDAF